MVSGPILESTGMRVILQKKGNKRAKSVKKGKKGKIFEILGEHVQNLEKKVEKGQAIASDKLLEVVLGLLEFYLLSSVIINFSKTCQSQTKPINCSYPLNYNGLFLRFLLTVTV